RHLRCPVGTVKSRLARGRERLRGRLRRRGISPSAGVLGAFLLSEAASAKPPGVALEAVAHAALKVTTGKHAGAGSAWARSFSLADEVSRSMVLSRLKPVAASVLAMAIACAGAGRVAVWSSGTQSRFDHPAAEPHGGGKTAEERRVPSFDEIRVVGAIKAVV